jgi:hypothetical protein
MSNKYPFENVNGRQLVAGDCSTYIRCLEVRGAMFSTDMKARSLHYSVKNAEVNILDEPCIH